MIILDSVTPEAWMHDQRKDTVHNYVKELWLSVRTKQVEHYTKPLYSRETVESLIASLTKEHEQQMRDCRKQALIEAAERFRPKHKNDVRRAFHVEAELRRMAESDKGGNDENM